MEQLKVHDEIDLGLTKLYTDAAKVEATTIVRLGENAQRGPRDLSQHHADHRGQRLGYVHGDTTGHTTQQQPSTHSVRTLTPEEMFLSPIWKGRKTQVDRIIRIVNATLKPAELPEPVINAIAAEVAFEVNPARDPAGFKAKYDERVASAQQLRDEAAVGTLMAYLDLHQEEMAAEIELAVRKVDLPGNGKVAAAVNAIEVSTPGPIATEEPAVEAAPAEEAPAVEPEPEIVVEAKPAPKPRAKRAKKTEATEPVAEPVAAE
jgi:hypothetical protein